MIPGLRVSGVLELVVHCVASRRAAPRRRACENAAAKSYERVSRILHYPAEKRRTPAFNPVSISRLPSRFFALRFVSRYGLPRADAIFVSVNPTSHGPPLFPFVFTDRFDGRAKWMVFGAAMASLKSSRLRRT